MEAVRLPHYGTIIHTTLCNLITKDSGEGQGAFTKPARTATSDTVEIHTRQSLEKRVSELVKMNVDKFMHYHDHAGLSNASIAAALNAMCTGMVQQEVINTCSLLVTCGLSAGKDAFPPSYVAHVERIGSFNGRLRENYDEIMGTENSTEGFRQNYYLFLLQKQDTLALRWLAESGGSRHIPGVPAPPSEIQETYECASLWPLDRPGMIGPRRRMRNFLVRIQRNPA